MPQKTTRKTKKKKTRKSRKQAFGISYQGSPVDFGDMALGDVIEISRRGMGMSAEALAALAGVHRQTVRNRETHQTNGRWDINHALLEALGYTIIGLPNSR